MIHLFDLKLTHTNSVAYRETEHTKAKKAHTRQRLLKAARDLVAEGGFTAATAAAVAQRSDVAAGSIYRHFPNKAELVAEVFRYATEHEIEMVYQATQTNSRCAERLQAGLTVFAQRALQGPRLAYALIAEPVDPRVEEERLKYRLAYAEIFEDLIREGMAAGEFVEQQPALSAAALVGMLSESLIGPLFVQREQAAINNSDQPDHKFLISQLNALCLRAVGCQKN